MELKTKSQCLRSGSLLIALLRFPFLKPNGQAASGNVVNPVFGCSLSIPVSLVSTNHPKKLQYYNGLLQLFFFFTILTKYEDRLPSLKMKAPIVMRVHLVVLYVLSYQDAGEFRFFSFSQSLIK